MKKYNQVKVIDEENEEELNEDTKEEQGQNDFFIKDQEPNELRKIVRTEKIKKEKERSKTLINFNKLFNAIGWNKEENNIKNQSFIKEEESDSSDLANSENKTEDQLEIFSEDENFMQTNNKNRRNYFDESIIFEDNYSFKQTYKNLIKQIKGEKIFLSKNLKNKLLFNLEINIGDFIVSEGLFFNYVNYELEGKIKKKIFYII